MFILILLPISAKYLIKDLHNASLKVSVQIKAATFEKTVLDCFQSITGELLSTSLGDLFVL